MMTPKARRVIEARELAHGMILLRKLGAERVEVVRARRAVLAVDGAGWVAVTEVLHCPPGEPSALGILNYPPGSFVEIETEARK